MTVFLLTNDIVGQIAPSDKAILTNLLTNVKTCNTFYFTDRTDSLFINQFLEALKKPETWLHSEGKSQKIHLPSVDKTKITQELILDKKNVWTDETMLDNGKIVRLDSIFQVDIYIDSPCLLELEQSTKDIKIFSICKPIYLTEKNSFVIYVIEIGLKWKKFYYASSKLMLFHKAGDKWEKAGDLYNGYFCNG